MTCQSKIWFQYVLGQTECFLCNLLVSDKYFDIDNYVTVL